jgi:hypothetical protein
VLQVSTPLFEQVVELGVHWPTHAPLTQAWFEHATAPPHWPFDPQIWTPFPEQVIVPGTHTPVHAPFTQAYGHAVPVPNVPVLLHVATALLEPPLAPGTQLVVFGAQLPWHDAAPLAPTQA